VVPNYLPKYYFIEFKGIQLKDFWTHAVDFFLLPTTPPTVPATTAPMIKETKTGITLVFLSTISVAMAAARIAVLRNPSHLDTSMLSVDFLVVVRPQDKSHNIVPAVWNASLLDSSRPPFLLSKPEIVNKGKSRGG
jgi:hypothetical protein